MGPHVLLAGYVQIAVRGTLEVAAYSNADWRFWLPGIGGDATFFKIISLAYKHVHASWRDESLGDYNLMMLAINVGAAVASTKISSREAIGEAKP